MTTPIIVSKDPLPISTSDSFLPRIFLPYKTAESQKTTVQKLACEWGHENGRQSVQECGFEKRDNSTSQSPKASLKSSALPIFMPPFPCQRFLRKKKALRFLQLQGFSYLKSGRGDSNSRPLPPQGSALIQAALRPDLVRRDCKRSTKNRKPQSQPTP